MTTAKLFANLSGDAWRLAHPFSDDLLQANALLHNTAATEAEMAESATLWCLRRQPCQFGRVAASRRRIHFCFLSERAVSEWTDDEIAEKARRREATVETTRGIRATEGRPQFRSGCRVAAGGIRTPDQHLRAFSDHILELAGWGPDRRGLRRRNMVAGDFLYLKHPTQNSFFGYKFNVDYFCVRGAMDGGGMITGFRGVLRSRRIVPDTCLR